MMMTPRILVAGVGNIFLGDDAFGVEVARKLLERPLANGIEVVDFGIRGFDLAYALLDDYSATILVDATARGGTPGTLYLIEHDIDEANGSAMPAMRTHNVNPVEVLALVKALGGQPKHLYVVGCEPATFGDENGQMDLSPPVQAAVEEAVRLVESVATQLLAADSRIEEREESEVAQ